MSRLNKADDIIELGLMLQSSSRGISIDDIAEKFECSRRSAERMKTVLLKNSPKKLKKFRLTIEKSAGVLKKAL